MKQTKDLRQIIIDKIVDEGPISFETFMDMALYYGDLGYYSSPERSIGSEGDFYTSPHLHPVFGAMLCRQLIEMWRALGNPSSFSAIEIGAGLGYVCRDIFNYLKKTESINGKDDFLKAFKYVIVEPYLHFEKKQRDLIEPIIYGSSSGGARETANIQWIKSVDEINNIRGCILSNELIDAFPVHLVEMEDELREVYVNFDGHHFTEEKKGPLSKELKEYMELFSVKLSRGYRTEINTRAKQWIASLSDKLMAGFILTIDYGYSTSEYYNEERSRGTLLCYHKHDYNEDPYSRIGEQDLTAHVNFSSLKKWGEYLGIRTLGYCPQGTYLTAAGIDEVITELYEDSPDYLSEISKIKGLIMPQGMGASHNVMIQYKGTGNPDLRGFSLRNLAENL